MAKIVYDLAVKTGEYEKDGQTKGRYKNVGALWKNDNGHFITLDKTFNPAGVDSDGDRIFISCFEKDGGSKPEPKSEPVNDSDSIPF